MSHVTYKVVEHDGGWAYTVSGVFSEPFPTHAMALAAARRAAAEQRVPGRPGAYGGDRVEAAGRQGAHRDRRRRRPSRNQRRRHAVAPMSAFGRVQVRA